MYAISCSALDRHDADFRVMVMSCFRSSVAISPAKRSVTAMAVAFKRERLRREFLLIQKTRLVKRWS